MSEAPLHPAVRWAATIYATACGALLGGGAVFLFLSIRFGSNAVAAIVGAMFGGGIAGLLGPYIFRNLTVEGRKQPARPSRLTIGIHAVMAVFWAVLLVASVWLTLRPGSRGFRTNALAALLFFGSSSWSFWSALRKRRAMGP